MAKVTGKTIYELGLNEWTMVEDRICVLRVPGGWLYEFDERTVFVPFNNEFQEESK